MGLRLVAKNALRTDRYISDYGLTSAALVGVELEVEGKVKGQSGFMMDVEDLRELFYELIGDCWDRATLVEEGQCVDVPIEPIVYVDFSPSLENIAKSIYECMASIIERRYDVRLIKVIAQSDIANAVYVVKHRECHHGEYKHRNCDYYEIKEKECPEYDNEDYYERYKDKYKRKCRPVKPVKQRYQRPHR